MTSAGGLAVNLEDYARAILNILEDASAEKQQLQATQKAVLNILDDFEGEKSKVDEANDGLRREVVERRHAEAELIEMSAALQRSNADLEQFAYVASHDLQEPLRMVSSYMQLFAKRHQGHVDEQSEKYIRYAVDGAQRMQALIAALLEYSRVGRTSQPELLQSEGALEQAIFNLRSLIDETDAEVEGEDLPAVVVDQNELVQVFQNLIANAIKFRRQGVRPRVQIRATRQDSMWHFAVEDNGIGLDPKYAERIFVIFQRLHTREQYAGTGIGLSICKKVVERHGGTIWVESRLGEGSTFHFTLPA